MYESLLVGSLSTKLPKELWNQISTDNPTTYYKLLQVSKVFKLDTDTMKAKFIRVTVAISITHCRLPNNWLHSCNDQPAIILADGTQRWCKDGKLHRDNDQPAEIWKNGNQFWYINGKLHRDNDQPAVIDAIGRKHWYINGVQYHSNHTPTTSHTIDTEPSSTQNRSPHIDDECLIM